MKRVNILVILIILNYSTSIIDTITEFSNNPVRRMPYICDSQETKYGWVYYSFYSFMLLGWVTFLYLNY